MESSGGRLTATRGTLGRGRLVAAMFALALGAAPTALAQGIHAVAPGISAPPPALPVSDSSRVVSRYALIGLGIVAAATGNQLLGSPKGWDKSWGGYARRLGDQVGFAVVEEGVRLTVDAVVDWVPDTTPCGASSTRFARLVRRTGCAIRRTALMRTPAGDARPNAPFMLGVVAASAASLWWRPEGREASAARALLLTRVGVVFSASALTTLVTTWRDP